MTFGGIFAYKTAENFGMAGWTGPGGMIAMTGLGVFGAVASKASKASRLARERAAADAEWTQWTSEFHPRLHTALWRLCDEWQSKLLWSSLGLGRLADARGPESFPLLMEWPTDPPALALWLPTGARIALKLPDGPSARDFDARLDKIASSLDVPRVQISYVDGNVVCLDLRVVDPVVDRDQLDAFHPRLHPALIRLRDSWQACDMWTALGFGRAPSGGDPGAWPQLVPSASVETPDDGVCWTPVGARVRVQLPDDVSGPDLRAKSDKLSSSMDVWKVRVHDVDGNKVRLDLYVVDTLAEILPSPLIKAIKEPRPDGTIGTRFVSAVPIGSLSCYDDVLLGLNEFGGLMPINFAYGVHRAVQGATRSGKSVTLYTMILASLLMRDTVTVIIDPNGATVAPFWQCADYVCDSQDPKDAVAMLDIILEEMARRKQLFARLRSDRITDFSAEVPLWNIFIDENSNYTHDKKYNEKLKKVAKQVAKFGGRITLADQKLDHESLSTAIRINLFDRICHRVEAREDFDHLLPGLPDLAKEAANSENPMPQGIAIARLMSHQRPVRTRMYLLPSEALYDIGDQITAELGAKRPPMWEDQQQPQAAATHTADEGGKVFPLRAVGDGTEEAPLIDQAPGPGRCLYCGRELKQVTGGRPAKYCRDRNCRQDYHRLKNQLDNKARGGN